MGFYRRLPPAPQCFHERCFIKTGDCGVNNGDFEERLASNIEGVYTPWEVAFSGLQNGNDAASLGNTYQNPHINGGDYYLLLSVEGDSKAFLSQDVVLAHNAPHTVILQFILMPSDSLAGYELVLSYGGQDFGTQVLEDTAGWISASFQFTSGAAPGNGPEMNGSQLFAITLQQAVGTITPPERAMKSKRIVAPLASATVGWDDIVMTKVTREL